MSYPAFLFYPTSFGWCVGWFGLLGLWLLGFVENTYSDGWIMDRETNVTFWCDGCLVCLLLIACVIQCLMDTHFFCLCAWRMDGWMLCK